MNQQLHKHRQELLTNIPKDATAILVAGNAPLSRNADTTYPFRQDSNILYLSGITLPNVALYIDTKTGNSYLVLPRHTKVEIMFDDVHEYEYAATAAGLNGCITQTELLVRLQKLSKKGEVLFNKPACARSHGQYANPYRRYWLNKLTKAGIVPIDVRPYVAAMRMIKKPHEIAAITSAVQVTQTVLSKYINNPAELVGRTETSVANEITAAFYENNMMNAYQPIVATDQNAVIVHHAPSDTPIKTGAGLLFDVGAEHCGYAADISRTIVVGHNQKLQMLIDDVAAVQADIIASLKPGIFWKDIQLQAQTQLLDVAKKHALITQEPVQTVFPYAIGHHVGLDVHDAADYSLSLSEGMVITIEPGLHSKKHGIGIRIEDDVVITKNGAKILK